MTTTLRPRLDPNFSTDTVKAPVWRNVLFERTGESHLCLNEYTTEQEALDHARAAVAAISGLRDGVDTIWYIAVNDGRDTPVLVADISHFMQIPWNQQ
jgi:hypothetical protein